MLNCKVCGYELSQSAKYCDNCGTKTETQIPPHQIENGMNAPQQAPMFTPTQQNVPNNWGAPGQNAPTQQNAPSNWGTPQPYTAVNSSPVAKKSNAGLIIALIVFGVVVIIGLVLIITVLLPAAFAENDANITLSILDNPNGNINNNSIMDTSFSDYWNGTWFGVISTYDSTGKYTAATNVMIDAYLVVDVGADGRGQFNVYTHLGSGEPFIVGECVAVTYDGVQALDCYNTQIGDITVDGYSGTFHPKEGYTDKYRLFSNVADADGDSITFELLIKPYADSWMDEVNTEYPYDQPTLYNIAELYPEPIYTINDITNIPTMDIIASLGLYNNLETAYPYASYSGSGMSPTTALSSLSYWYGALEIRGYNGKFDREVYHDVWGVINETEVGHQLQIYDTRPMNTTPIMSVNVVLTDDLLLGWDTDKYPGWIYDKYILDEEMDYFSPSLINGALHIQYPYETPDEEFTVEIFIREDGMPWDEVNDPLLPPGYEDYKSSIGGIALTYK